MAENPIYSKYLQAMIKSGMAEGAATDWLFRPNPVLNNLRPMDACWTEAGQKAVTKLLSDMGIKI